MYLLILVFFMIALLFFIINYYRRKKIIKKICCMSQSEKCCLLNSLIEPAGFQYDMDQDIFTSLVESWQREMGYTALYDEASPALNMVFDCEPIYFDYEGVTWMFEFWKGQYGINTGGEIGFYRAYTLIPRGRRHLAIFHGLPNQDLIRGTLEIWKDDRLLFDISQKHWWITGFSMGEFSFPESLTLKASIVFPDKSMLTAFLKGLNDAGYSEDEYDICGVMLSMAIDTPKHAQPRNRHRLSAAFSQLANRIYCRLYLWVTKPFCSSLDRLLYLYYFIPWCFRRMINIRKCKRRWRKR